MSHPERPLNVEAAVADRAELEREFLSRFEPRDRAQAQELLELGRASYRIRDDENIYLDRFRELLHEAESLGRDRLTRRGAAPAGDLDGPELVRSLSEAAYTPRRTPAPPPESKPREVLRPEQLFALRQSRS